MLDKRCSGRCTGCRTTAERWNINGGCTGRLTKAEEDAGLDAGREAGLNADLADAGLAANKRDGALG